MPERCRVLRGGQHRAGSFRVNDYTCWGGRRALWVHSSARASWPYGLPRSRLQFPRCSAPAWRRLICARSTLGIEVSAAWMRSEPSGEGLAGHHLAGRRSALLAGRGASRGCWRAQRQTRRLPRSQLSHWPATRRPAWNSPPPGPRPPAQSCATCGMPRARKAARPQKAASAAEEVSWGGVGDGARN